MADLLKEFLRLSAILRPNYPGSLSTADSGYADKISAFWPNPIPELIITIYSLVAGTNSSIQDQRLMDFLPGYRLIHIDELSPAYLALSRMTSNNNLFPFLANYSSDYICVWGDAIYDFTHGTVALTRMHDSGEAFLRTLCEFYNRGIYFLDENSFLDYDAEREGVCGAELNPGIEYWTE